MKHVIVIHTINMGLVMEALSSFGMEFKEEQHEKGPAHWAAENDDFVVEIYPPSQTAGDVVRVRFE